MWPKTHTLTSSAMNMKRNGQIPPGKKNPLFGRAPYNTGGHSTRTRVKSPPIYCVESPLSVKVTGVEWIPLASPLDTWLITLPDA